MNNNEGGINFTIGLDNSQLQADAAKATAQLRGIGNTAAVEGTRMQNAFNTASGYITMAAMAGVASIGILGKTILDTTAKFEKFGIVLKNTLGDVKGGEALSMIANFAATTPFQLDEVTGAFIKLANQGFVPTYAEMTKLGDLASSTGKSFDQLGEALLDAQTGQFERLKEFGIKASANGDKVTFSFKEQQTTVSNTNSAIQKYILSLGELKGVAGANALISASLTGQMSNLGDKLAAMYNEIGTSNKGFLYSAVGGVSSLIENYKAVGEVLTGLIAVYGTYKVAVMYIAYTETLAAAAKTKSIAIETAYQAIIAQGNIHMAARARGLAVEVLMQEARVTATGQVIAAEKALKASTATTGATLANPYVLAAMAAVALGYAIYKVINNQTDLQKAQESYNKVVQEFTSTTEAERLELDAVFSRLKAAKEGTDEYKAAKTAIFSKYGEQLKSLGDEKTALNDIALAYKTITEESLKSARARGMAKITGDATAAAAEVTGDARAKVNALLNDKFKGQKGADGIGLAQTYFAKIVPVLEGKEAITKDIQDIISQFDRSDLAVSGGTVVSTSVVKSNALQSQINNATRAKEILDKTMADARVKFGEIEADPNKDPILTTYQAQLDIIKGKKAIAEKELATLMTKKGVDPKKDIDAKEKEIAEYNKQLGVKESKATIDREKEVVEAMKTATGEKLAMLAQELAALQKLKELREKIVALALFEAKYSEENNKVPTMMIGKTGQIVTTKDPTKYKAQDVIDESKKSVRANDNQIKALNDGEEESLKKQVKLREDVFYAAESLTGVLTKNGMLSEEQGSAISESLNGFKALASGDFLGAAMTVVSQIASMFPSQAEQFQDRIDKINVALKEQQRLIELADRFGGERVALEKQLQLLKDKRSADGEALQRAEDKRDNKIFKIGPVYKGYVKDVNELTAALVEDQNAIQDTETALQDFLTGGITENTLADAIAQGFQDGKTSVDDFATYMNDVLTNAGVEIFKGLLLDSPEMKEYMEYVKTAYTGGILSPEEKFKIDQMAAEIGAKFAPAWDNLTGALGKNDINKADNSMKGKVSAAITENTATEFVGRVNMISIDVREIINMSKASSNHLLNIAANTLRTADNTDQLSQLSDITKSLKSLDSKIRDSTFRW